MDAVFSVIQLHLVKMIHLTHLYYLMLIENDSVCFVDDEVVDEIACGNRTVLNLTCPESHVITGEIVAGWSGDDEQRCQLGGVRCEGVPILMQVRSI